MENQTAAGALADPPVQMEINRNVFVMCFFTQDTTLRSLRLTDLSRRAAAEVLQQFIVKLLHRSYKNK